MDMTTFWKEISSVR